MEDFLAGIPDSLSGGTVLNGNPLRHLRQEDYSGFFEDSWHLLPHVTLNYGLRYEYFTVMRDANNLIGNWDPTVGFEQVGVNVNSAYNGYHKDFSPRLGIAWDIGGKGKTVVRAGGGVYYVDLVAAALVDQTQIPGKASGLTAIPTAYSTGANGTAAPLDPLTSGGIGTASLSFPGSSLNWSLAGPIFPAGTFGSSSGFSCGDGTQGRWRQAPETVQRHRHRQEYRSAPGGDLDPGHSAHANQQLYVGSELYRRSQQQSDRCSGHQCHRSGKPVGKRGRNETLQDCYS